MLGTKIRFSSINLFSVYSSLLNTSGLGLLSAVLRSLLSHFRHAMPDDCVSLFGQAASRKWSVCGSEERIQKSKNLAKLGSCNRPYA